MLPLLALALAAAADGPAPDARDAPVTKGQQRAGHAARRAADGDDEDDNVDPNSPVVVTARRLDAARTQIGAGLGATVYALSNETIENRPGGETGSIAAVLTQAPGVTPSGRSVTVRGSGSVQVRINDVIVPEAISDPAEHLSARLAETTRLMTGTLPAQFGFAEGGVISVTTKSGSYQHGGQAELFASTDALLEPAVEWAGSVAGTRLFASGSFERDRTRLADATGASTSDLRGGFEGLVYAERLLNERDRVSLILGGSRERHRIGATRLGSGNAANDDGYAVASFQHSSGRLTLQTSLFAAAATDRQRFVADSEERRTSFGTQVDVAERVGSGHVVRAGLLLTRAASRDLACGGDSRMARRTTTGLYAQDEWAIVPGVTINPGVRVEWLRGLAHGAAVEPRASVVWTPASGLTTHIGYARYASAAPLGEDRGGSLPAERDTYFDAGLQQRAGPFTFGVDAYLRDTRNLIATHETIGQAAPLAFEFARAHRRGVEFSAIYAHGAATAWADLAVSRVRGRSILGGTGLFPAATVRAADAWIVLPSDRPVVGSGGVTWRLDHLSLSADVLASSGAPRTAAPGDPDGARGPFYAVFGLAAVYRVRLLERPTDLRLDLTNVGNVRYATREATSLDGGWTVRGRGRALTIGIEQGF